MAKKQFIRHLEYYGFPDQNGYTSNIGNMDVDLSELKNKDKEHDKEIKCLENEKANKKDLLELSNTVDEFIDMQSQVNRTIVNELSGITADIDTLKEVDNQYGEQLSGLTDGVNSALSSIQTINRNVNDIKDDLAELSGKVETFSANTQEKLDEISEELDKKADKEELENFVSKEWVEEQGYLTVASGDSRYVKIGDIDEISGAVTDLSDKVDAISGDVAELSSTTESRINELEDEVDEKIDTLSATVETFDDRITQNTEDIDALEDEMDRKANKADLEVLETTVSNLSDLVDGKVSKVEFETYKDLVENQFIDMDDKKADKTALTEVNDAIQDTNDRIDQEIANRISGDTYIQNQITNINNEIIEIKEESVDYGDRIQNLEDGLAQEIADRQQADIDLIGQETDPYDADTIWGAKNFAKNQKRQAVTEANLYTDQEIDNVEEALEREHEWAEQNFSSAASKSYVDGKYEELEEELEGDINDAVEGERLRALAAEADLLRRILYNAQRISGNTDLIDLLSNRLNAITAWDGTDPDEYVNTGNGVLDVLHREFHEFEKNAGSIKEIRVEGDNLIIVYYTKDGEKETVIPIGELIDLSNYYNKQETDALLDEKLDVSAYTDISEQVAANTENIVIISGAVQDETDRAVSAETELNDALAALINRLGYTDNDTLERNGDHEVAFGQYNISNTSEYASGRTLFSIGNGTDDENRSNALEVKENGDVYLWIEGEFMNINKLLGQIAHEVYDADTNSHFFDGD